MNDLTEAYINPLRESVHLRRGVSLILILGALTLMIGAAPVMTAYQGGVDSSSQEFDCGGSCHNKASTATLSMTASNSSLTPGASVTVSVSVTGGQAGSIIGVMLVTTLSAVPESLPSAKGWTITSDPSNTGSTFNYHEVTNYAGSGTYTWTLTAPQTNDAYQLYARVMHGGGGQAFAANYAAGISFIVGTSGTQTGPVVAIISPTVGEKVDGSITISASIPSSVPLAYAILRIDGTIRENKTAGPFSWTLNTEELSDGEHVINVTAVDSNGKAGYNEISFTVDNAAANTLMLNWVWTMAAGSIAIIAIVSMMMVVALLIRRRIAGGAK
jgi:hypothetical protein